MYTGAQKLYHWVYGATAHHGTCQAYTEVIWLLSISNLALADTWNGIPFHFNQMVLSPQLEAVPQKGKPHSGWASSLILHDQRFKLQRSCWIWPTKKWKLWNGGFKGAKQCSWFKSMLFSHPVMNESSHWWHPLTDCIFWILSTVNFRFRRLRTILQITLTVLDSAR